MGKLTLVGMVDPVRSYGLHAIELARGLDANIRSIKTWEPWGLKIPKDIRDRLVVGPQEGSSELLVYPPGFCPTPGKHSAYLTMHESTRVRPEAVQMLNRADVVIVPCEWNACCFSASGVTRPIEIVPLGVNGKVFRYRGIPDEIKDVCVFSAAGRMAKGGPRKGINEVIEAFFKAFPYQQDVRLRVKVWPDCQVMQTDDPRVSIVKEYLTEEQLADWMSRSHCFVSAAKGEGWGLMQHQAMALGRPVIGANFGGLREFTHTACNYEVPYQLVPAVGSYAGLWAQPSESGLVDRMREVYNDRQTAIVKGAIAAGTVKHLTWENHISKLSTALERYGVIDEPPKPNPAESTPVAAKRKIRLRWRPVENPPTPVLADVTLWACCWSDDTQNLRQTERVLNYCKYRFEFSRIVLFSYLPIRSREFEVVQIPRLTMKGWNIWHVKEMPKLIDSAYAMSVHADGFPLAPELWRDEFLAYDFIGAPWVDGVVGNGGFCIESRRFMDAKAKLPDFTMPIEASDTYVSRTHRKALEAAGVRFAPTELAVEFSTEQTGRHWPSFGYHGRRDQPDKHALGWDLIEKSENLPKSAS